MSTRFLRLLVPTTVVFLAAAACSHLPRMSEVDEDTAALRAQYLSGHPDGEFNDRILSGEVVKGMGAIEVLASWGLPTVRRAHGERRTQYWTYYVLDETTSQINSYELVLEDWVLSRWIVETGVRLDGSPRRDVTQTPLAVGTANRGAMGGDTGVLKK